MSRWLVALLLTMSLTARAADSSNIYLAQAKVLYEGLEYERALQRLQQAAVWRNNSHQDQIDIELYSGLCEYNLGHREQARERFEMALKLDSHVKLPPGTSPRIGREFRETRTQAIARGAVSNTPEVTADVPVKAPEPASLAPRPEPVPPAPTVVVVEEKAAEPHSRAPSLAVGAAAVVAGGLGTYFGLQAKSSQDAANSLSTPWAQSQTDGTNAQHQATLANVAFAVAGSAAIAAVVLLITGH